VDYAGFECILGWFFGFVGGDCLYGNLHSPRSEENSTRTITLLDHADDERHARFLQKMKHIK